MNTVTATTIRQFTNHLEVLGIGPSLANMRSIEPVLHQHLIHAVDTFLSEGHSASSQERAEFQMQLMRVILLVVGPLLRTLHPPDTVATQQIKKYKMRLDALNAKAKAQAQKH
jgi:hypothetical protein